ncbi:MAG: hypothetical protein LBJ07_04990 [Actinomycetes bacterium]|jgi:two-component system phosphate regulon sensor histidine kinase PhoR|nr:hypothetical protein [Actinomycetes bacterium]
MKRAIYYRLIVLALAALSICSGISAMMYAVSTQNQTKAWLTMLAVSTAENYTHTTDVSALARAAGNNRVTIIAPDGTVLADSEANAADMENHADREEVKYAKTGDVYIAMRKSDTLNEMFMYVSVKTADGTIVRLAHSYSGLLHNLVVQLPAILVALIAALILSLVLADRFSKTVTKPFEKVVDALSAHEYAELGQYNSPYYEIDKIMQTLQELLREITDSNTKLQEERERVDYILSNMAEGFVLVDKKKNILLCNASAKEFFGHSPDLQLESIYNLTRNQTVINALQSAFDSGQSTMFDLRLQENLIVNLYISPSIPSEYETGATLLIVDMTAERQLEQQKRDFFSNASHELKTPITSILGFSEMLGKGIVVSEEEKAIAIHRIGTEAKRLSELIGDILTISKLESNSGGQERTLVNLNEIITEAIDAVSPIKDNISIEVNADAHDIFYQANQRQMYELCVNLIENAIKYNTPNGTVSLTLKDEGTNVVLSIRDTGIGIPPEYQARVFERFFRVDYGRDKKVGGTGLGLSIVKHIVSMYGGEISLQSRKDEGTTITVFLPVDSTV